ncbi:uncharacterized protein LOC141857421 [Brevipalpus obovatus]|uniref:uncharacterized protein LOC141857421 n=1 Tax=Brevipalpus obovatus TaxID=246614 RepID=UPI003D9E100D
MIFVSILLVAILATGRKLQKDLYQTAPSNQHPAPYLGTGRTSGRSNSTSLRSSTSSEPGSSGTTQTARCKPGHYPITGLERQGPVYNEDGTLWAERGVLVEHEKLVYRLEDVDAPDLEPKAYGPINAPGSGEKYMFGHSAADILAKEVEERKQRRQAKRGVNPEAKCRFCARWFTRREQRDGHERDRCRFPGSPHHECDELCRVKDEQCPSAKPYQKAPDRRFTR